MNGLAAYNALIFVGIAALVVLAIAGSVSGTPVNGTRLLVMPAILAVVGLNNLSNDFGRMSTLDIGLLLAITFAGEALLVLPKASKLGVPIQLGSRRRSRQAI